MYVRGLKFECGQGWTGTSLTFTGSKSTGATAGTCSCPRLSLLQGHMPLTLFLSLQTQWPSIELPPSPCLFMVLLRLLLGHCRSLAWMGSKRCFTVPKMQVFQQSPGVGGGAYGPVQG